MPVLLVVASRGASAAATVLGHAAADLGAANAIRLALPLRLQNIVPNMVPREEDRSSV